jgi:hypothetical protein
MLTRYFYGILFAFDKENKMPLNEDGLEIGQPVDFATIVRIENERKKVDAEHTPEKETPRRGRPANKPEH